MTVGAIALPVSRVRAPRWVVPVLVVVVAVGIARWASATYVVGVFHDDGVYALLARAIAAGDGFHYSHLRGAPAATHYPPLYPLALAAAWRIAPDFPHNLPVLLGLNALLVGASALGWWRFAMAHLGWGSLAAGAGALLATLASPTLALAGALLSELLFLALLWPALLVSERESGTSLRPRPWRAGLAIGVLMLVRAHAIALLVACMVVLASQRRWRAVGWVFLSAVGVQLPWLVWAHGAAPRLVAPLEGAYGSYSAWFRAGVQDGGVRFILGTVRANAMECWHLLQDRFAMGVSAPLLAVVVAIAVAAMVMGGISIARRERVTTVFLALYLAILLVWPYAPWRFLWAVWPMVMLFAMEGVRWSWELTGRWRLVPAMTAALPALAFFRTELHAYATRAWRMPARQASAQITPVITWVRANTTPADMLLAEGEPVIALYTGRRAAPPMSFTAREYLAPPDSSEGRLRLRTMLVAVPARYVLALLPATQEAARALATGRPGLRERANLPAAQAVAFEVVR